MRGLILEVLEIPYATLSPKPELILIPVIQGPSRQERLPKAVLPKWEKLEFRVQVRNMGTGTLKKQRKCPDE